MSFFKPRSREVSQNNQDAHLGLPASNNYPGPKRVWTPRGPGGEVTAETGWQTAQKAGGGGTGIRYVQVLCT